MDKMCEVRSQKFEVRSNLYLPTLTYPSLSTRPFYPPTPPRGGYLPQINRIKIARRAYSIVESLTIFKFYPVCVKE